MLHINFHVIAIILGLGLLDYQAELWEHKAKKALRIFMLGPARHRIGLGGRCSQLMDLVKKVWSCLSLLSHCRNATVSHAN